MLCLCRMEKKKKRCSVKMCAVYVRVHQDMSGGMWANQSRPKGIHICAMWGSRLNNVAGFRPEFCCIGAIVGPGCHNSIRTQIILLQLFLSPFPFFPGSLRRLRVRDSKSGRTEKVRDSSVLFVTHPVVHHSETHTHTICFALHPPRHVNIWLITPHPHTHS